MSDDLEDIIARYTKPIKESIDRLEASLRSGDAREIARLRVALEGCERDLAQLIHDNTELHQNIMISRDTLRILKEKVTEQESVITSQQATIAMQASALENREGGA